MGLLPCLLGRVLPGQNRQQGGFPTAVGPDHRHLPSLHRKHGWRLRGIHLLGFRSSDMEFPKIGDPNIVP